MLISDLNDFIHDSVHMGAAAARPVRGTAPPHLQPTVGREYLVIGVAVYAEETLAFDGGYEVSWKEIELVLIR